MMKKIFIILFVCACAASFSFAQPSKDGALDDMVYVSLEGLKNSYQKLSEQNRLLASEIEGYREHIRSLQRELDSFGPQRMESSVTRGGEEKAGGMFPEAIDRQEIELLTGKLDATSEQAIEKEFQQKKSELERALEQSRKNLRAARLEADKIKENSAGGASAIAQLKARQAQLRRQIAGRQSSLDLGASRAYVRQMDKEIAKLKSRQRELGKKLSPAPDEESADISRFTEETFQLRRRFVALHDENMRLKKELFRFGTIGVPPQP
jgi:chromosome segregation ATPase